MQSYKQGELVRVSGVFETPAGDPTDPTTVKVTIVRPDGDTSTYVHGTDAALVKASVGDYYIDVSATIPGVWTYWWHSEGTGQAADEKKFLVDPAEAADAVGAPRTLGVDYTELRRAVGRFLGIGREGIWETTERNDVHDIIRSAYRRFIWPPPLPIPSGSDGQIVHISASKANDRPTWSWSFLQTTTTLTTVSGTAGYLLADDFGELLAGGFTFTSSKEQPIGIVGHEQILQMQGKTPQTGVPKYASIGIVDATSTQYQATFYPTPDAVYPLSYTYSVAPKELNEANPIHLGGPQHAETLREACLAEAEKTIHDEDGLHEKKFIECLTRSMQADANISAQTVDDPWPLEDKAKGLGISKAYLKRLIGRQLQFGPHSATWNHRQASEVDLALETGLRKMYAPMVLPGERYSHEWSFLKPIWPIVTNDSEYTYDMPTGYVTLSGPLTYAPDEGNLWPSVEIVPEYRIRQRLAVSTSAGRPRYGAVRVKPLDPAGGTLYELILWPPPDGEYHLSFPYQVNPGSMSEDACLPYGGQQLAQTLIEACLAAAEEQGGQVNGPHAAKFLECLIASVSSDRRTGCPETLGYNGDLSDRPEVDDRQSHYCSENIVTYNGLSY